MEKHNPSLPPGFVPYRRSLFRGREISVYYDRQKPIVTEERQHEADVQVMLVFEPGECALSWRSPAGPQEQKIVGPHLAIIASRVPHAWRWERESDLLVLYIFGRLW